jgi:hypothetical protein
MARLWIGTSGWVYKEWLGLFYPARQTNHSGAFGRFLDLRPEARPGNVLMPLRGTTPA